VDLTGMTVEAVKEFGLSRKDASRAKNMFALGLLSWMYGRPTESTHAFLAKRFAKVPDIRDANIAAFKAGWNFGETTETFIVRYEIKPAPMSPGTYRNITGNLALSYGLVAGGVSSRASRSSSAPTRSPRRPTSSTSCRSTRASA
jgi:2-oxoglutarate/2-oxoacid ferredoxin oxidoreductase subunit alpha